MLERSWILKRVDNEPVWSIVCLFIARLFRRQGISVRLLRAAVDHARQGRARIVEGYPVEPRKDDVPDLFPAPQSAHAYQSSRPTAASQQARSYWSVIRKLSRIIRRVSGATFSAAVSLKPARILTHLVKSSTVR